MIFRRQKNQNKIHKCTKNRIKWTNAQSYFECACLH